MRAVVLAVVLLLLLSGLLGSFYLGYRGIGVTHAGPSVRQGSLGGISFYGGGPSSGK